MDIESIFKDSTLSDYDFCLTNSMGYIPIKSGKKSLMIRYDKVQEASMWGTATCLSCYKGLKTGKTNLSAVMAVGIKATGIPNTRQFLKNALSKGISMAGDDYFPMPTIVQYDTASLTDKHTARMIWFLDKPFVLSTLIGKRKQACIDMLNGLAERLSNVITSLSGRQFKAMKITDYIPLNGKYGSTKRGTIHGLETLERYHVCTVKVGEPVSFDDLHEISLFWDKDIVGGNVVDELSKYSYDEIRVIPNYLSRRRAFLARFARDCPDFERHELLRDYSNVCLTMKYSMRRMKLEVSWVNRRFKHPLEGDLSTMYLISKPFKVTDKIFYGHYKRPDMVVTYGMSREERNAKKRSIYQEKTKESRAKRNQKDEEILRLYNQGVSINSIKAQLHTGYAHIQKVLGKTCEKASIEKVNESISKGRKALSKISFTPYSCYIGSDGSGENSEDDVSSLFDVMMSRYVDA